MAFEIVDGRTGTPHISSEDLACFNEAIIGQSNCVFEWGNEFTCTMSDANTATIASGAGMVGGKRFWNQASTNVTIQSGTQGQNRNDLIVARYDITDDGIESITPTVIKGTATTGTATDPSVTDDDLPLYRIPLSGISVGQPVKLFEPVQSISSFRDSISQNSKRSEWGSSYVQYQKRGGIVVCSGQVETTIPQWQQREISTIPDEFMPSLDKTDGVFINISGLGTMTAYGSNGLHPGKLYAMAIKAVTSNAIVFNLSWTTNA